MGDKLVLGLGSLNADHIGTTSGPLYSSGYFVDVACLECEQLCLNGYFFEGFLYCFLDR